MKVLKLLFLSFFVLTCLHASSAEDVVKDALVSKKIYTISGTFGTHDFPESESAFDWAFTLPDGTSYQLQGKAPSDNDVFGWKEVSIKRPVPAWYMIFLGSDVDGDGNTKFDWVLLSTDMSAKSVYKLKGVTSSGTFDYTDAIDVDYSVDGNTITIEDNSRYFTTTKTVSSTKETLVSLKGEGDDLLTITIARLPFGTSKDMNITFSLVYADSSPLPKIEIDTDIKFDKAVTLKFQSGNLSADRYVFVYHADTRDYFVPFVKEGSVYSAKLMHFSDYGFDKQPSDDALKASIESELSELESYRGDDGLDGLNENLMGDILSKIELLDSDTGSAYMEKLMHIIEAAVDRWLAKMKHKSVPYWDHYCSDKEFIEFLTDLIRTENKMEIIGAKSIDADVMSLVNHHMKAAYEEWKTLLQPKACNTSDMRKYIDCGSKFMVDAEIMGVDISSQEQIKILLDYIEGNILYVLANASCPEIDCVKYYLSMAHSGELETIGIGHDYTQELEDKVDEIQKKIDEKTCEKPKWILNIKFIQPDITVGSVTYRNFTIDCDDPIAKDAFYGDECAYLSLPDYTDIRTSQRAEVSYSGDLSDPELVPLIIYEGGIDFSAKSTSEIGAMAFEQIGSFVYDGEYSHAPLEHCFGNFQSDTLKNIKDAKISQWTSDHPQGFTYCTFTLKPCKDEECSLY